jgi:hypothetical protein
VLNYYSPHSCPVVPPNAGNTSKRLQTENPPRGGKELPSDYIDPRLETALEKAASLLASRAGEWSSVVEAYWLLRRHEDEIGFPLTYNMVEEAVERAKRFLEKERHLAIAEA